MSSGSTRRRHSPDVRSSPGCSVLGQPGTSFWVRPALFEQGAGGLDHLQLGLELFDPPTGGLQGVGLVALGSRALTGVYEGLSPPAIKRVLGDPELGHEILDCLTGEHSLTRSAANLGGVVPWHSGS